MKPSGFDIIELRKNNYKPEAHDMKTPKMFFRYNGEDMSLVSVYNRNKKRRGRSRYLLSVMVDVVKDDENAASIVQDNAYGKYRVVR